MSEISDVIQQLAGVKGANKINIIEGAIVSVNEEERTCVVNPLSDNYEGNIEEVYLSAQPNDGIIQIPSVDSVVKVCVCMGIDFPFIIQFSDLDKIVILADTSIQFNDGGFGGLVKVEELVNKINALENQINNILNVLSTTTIPLAPSGTYPFAPLYSSITPIAPITQVTDINNPNITHG